MIWGYYDESGQYENGRLVNMTIGGCFAPLGQWQAFEAKWKKALADEGLAFFHMTDFEAWKPPYDFKLPDGSRDKERHNRLLNALLDIKLAHIEGFYGFGAVSMFDFEAPPLTHETLMEDCVGGAIKHAVLHVADYYGQPVNLIFGKQNHFGKGKIQKYVEFYDYGAAASRIKTFSMADMPDCPPLQAADIFAYEMGRAQRNGRDDRYPYKRIRDEAVAKGLNMSMSWGPVRSRRITFSSAGQP